MVELTRSQWIALQDVYERWNVKERLQENEITFLPSDTNDGRYFGIWVGATRDDRPGSLFLGIERDGYVHS